MEQRMQIVLQFFKDKAGFKRVLRAMYDTYSKHGRVFGAIRLTHPSTAEESAISEFFQRDYYNQALIRIGLADFERQVHKNFPDSEGISLGEILAEYMGKPQPKKHSVRLSKFSSAQKPGTLSSVILSEILPKHENTHAAPWLKEVSLQTRRVYRKWAEQFVTAPKIVTATLLEVADALNNLPEESLTPLASFSQKFCGNPNALDFHGSHGSLFLKALACRFNQPEPSSIEDCIKLHLRAGLLTCGNISGVTVFGLSAKIADGQSDKVCEYYKKTNQAFVLTLENIAQFSSVSAYGGRVFIFEDPQVFSIVCEQIHNTKCTLICPTNGFSAALMYLLEHFHTNEVTLFYAGNMNFKSLEQADKLYQKFGKTLIPWRYTHDDYTKILSQGSSPLPDEKKHLSLHNETLASLLSQMRKTGKTAPSITLIPYYIDDIKEPEKWTRATK